MTTRSSARLLAASLVAALSLTGCGLSSGGSIPYPVEPGSIRVVPEL